MPHAWYLNALCGGFLRDDLQIQVKFLCYGIDAGIIELSEHAFRAIIFESDLSPPNTSADAGQKGRISSGSIQSSTCRD
jgi:hypothetical protein